jgi:ABC-type sulfate transport system substrate-binding protein
MTCVQALARPEYQEAKGLFMKAQAWALAHQRLVMDSFGGAGDKTRASVNGCDSPNLSLLQACDAVNAQPPSERDRDCVGLMLGW